MNRQIERSATVGEAMKARRLDQAAAQLFPEFSRARLQGWIKAGNLLVDGQPAKQRDRVAVGAVLSLRAHLEAEVGWEAEELPLSVIYEDEALLVIDKPAGVVVHPGAGNADGTLVNALLNYRPELSNVPRAGIVHRLDKETSGLLVVAASLESHHHLVDQLQRKEVRREYYALIQGNPTGGGTVDAPIGRHPKHRTRMAVLPSGGKQAVTHYRIARRFAHFCALDVQLETGRTHQIRVHMAHRGFPLVGDPVYGGRLRLPPACSETLATALRSFRRQALHARRLSFIHPQSGADCAFESPVAEDIRALEALLAGHNHPPTAPS